MKYTVSEDQNTVVIEDENSEHVFLQLEEPISEDEDICGKCSLMRPCIKYGGEKDIPEFPFPCVDRKDERNGRFIKKEEE